MKSGKPAEEGTVERGVDAVAVQDRELGCGKRRDGIHMFLNDQVVAPSTGNRFAAPTLKRAVNDRDEETLLRHGDFAQLLLGSVSQQCAHHAECPVVIVRSKAQAK